MEESEKELYKIIQAYQNITTWNVFADEFANDFEEAKKVSESEAERVKKLCEKHFNKITEGYDENKIENENELKAFLRLKGVIEDMKHG